MVEPRCSFEAAEAQHRWVGLNLSRYLLSLDELTAFRYHVTIISNQKAISLKKDKKGDDSKSLTNFKERVSAVMKELDFPLSVYAATEDDEYRKPRIGMWREFFDDYDLDVSGIDTPASIFVGDAAGRPTDHSSVDR